MLYVVYKMTHELCLSLYASIHYIYYTQIVAFTMKLPEVSSDAIIARCLGKKLASAKTETLRFAHTAEVPAAGPELTSLWLRTCRLKFVDVLERDWQANRASLSGGSCTGSWTGSEELDQASAVVDLMRNYIMDLPSE